ncbi:hypothetical protein SLEP1_g31311 [Rubroshorea leprosula]|uniref:Uncharacterized protein n=1 Tax=Rubroshorea leprosula TaxID=152421 RepID=A0AAV5K834_9ROSI|nr:hypothetical protein SLEP1_g31311 [Rubroshorea leprosula]
MQDSQQLNKIPSSSRLLYLVFISSSVCVIYLLVSLFLVEFSKPADLFSISEGVQAPTRLEHIVFGISSDSNSWRSRKDYVELWWKSNRMRGCVFLESPPRRNISDSSLPPVCVSEDTSRFRYTYRWGYRSAIRIARVVKETVLLNHSNVRWYVFGEDDTVFFPENLVKTLRKYDHRLWYYIGANSEIYEQNHAFGFEMAFSGAGFAISASLAEVLANIFDSCIERYPHLYGSESRIYNCLAELGVGLTREPGFHQLDVSGNAFGLLASHPLTPLVSLHLMDHIDPIFPNMTRSKAMEHLLKAANVDSERILQQTVCYDRWFSWTISVTWGYAIQVHSRHVFLPDLLPAEETFRKLKLKSNNISGVYTFNTREYHPDPCRRPTIFFLDSVSFCKNGIRTIYKKYYENCSYDMGSPRKLDEIRVFSQQLDLDTKQLQAPRRHCCDVLPSSGIKLMEIAIRECRKDEMIYMH